MWLTTIPDLLTAGIALASLTLLLRYKVNSIWLIGGGGILGLIHTLR